MLNRSVHTLYMSVHIHCTESICKSVHNYVAQKCAADAQTCADALTFACGSRTGCGLSVCSWFTTFVFILTVSFVKY
jgi:murein endopeptidase